MQRYHPLALGKDGALPALADARLSLGVLPDVTAVQVMALPGRAAALATALGLDPVVPGMAAPCGGLALLPVTPGEWLAFAPDGTQAEGLAERIGAAGYLCDLGDSYCALTVSGALADAVLARGCRLDLDRWAARSCAQTEMAGLSVILHRPGAEQNYILLVAASMARSFWHWLEGAAISALLTD